VSEYIEILVTGGIALLSGGALGAWITARAKYNKTEAEADKLQSEASHAIVTAALDISDRLQIQLLQMQEQIDALDERNIALKETVDDLQRQNIDMFSKITVLEQENKKLHSENRSLKEKLDDYKDSD